MQQFAPVFPFFFMGACPRIPLTDSQLPTLNVHYRTFFVLTPWEHVPNKLADFFVVVAMNTNTLKLFLP